MIPHPVKELSVEEKKSWIRLIRSQNVGPVAFYELLKHYRTPANALAHLPQIAKRAGGRKKYKIAPESIAKAEIRAMEKLGGQIIAACEPAYPPMLRAIDDPPPVLYVLGHSHLLNQNCIGMVGTRNASINGRNFARKISFDLSENGLVVVSGMAKGIDTAAHEGALNSRNPEGNTIAVLGCGVDVVYPLENTKLHAALAAQACIVSEVPPGSEPHRGHFPRRNRIISGLSRSIVVVEASVRSGSLITARQALSQGRDVFAVPGSPVDPRSHGPNQLIREGAILTESVNDILNEWSSSAAPVLEENNITMVDQASFAPPVDTIHEIDNSQAYDIVLSSLSCDPVAIDELVRQCGVTHPVLATAILDLELAGRIERHPGNRVSLIREPSLF